MSEGQVVEALRGVDLDGAEPQTVLTWTDKTLVARGRHRGRPAVLKVLRSTDQNWQARFRREIQLYQAFQTHPPPVRVPELYYANGGGLMYSV